jgi:hypothetical protein
METMPAMYSTDCCTARASGYQMLALDVQMTSRRWMFIHESQLTKCPLYVSPDFNSTSYSEAKSSCQDAQLAVDA